MVDALSKLQGGDEKAKRIGFKTGSYVVMTFKTGVPANTYDYTVGLRSGQTLAVRVAALLTTSAG